MEPGQHPGAHNRHIAPGVRGLDAADDDRLSATAAHDHDNNDQRPAEHDGDCHNCCSNVHRSADGCGHVNDSGEYHHHHRRDYIDHRRREHDHTCGVATSNNDDDDGCARDDHGAGHDGFLEHDRSERIADDNSTAAEQQYGCRDDHGEHGDDDACRDLYDTGSKRLNRRPTGAGRRVRDALRLCRGALRRIA